MMQLPCGCYYYNKFLVIWGYINPLYMCSTAEKESSFSPREVEAKKFAKPYLEELETTLSCTHPAFVTILIILSFGDK